MQVDIWNQRGWKWWLEIQGKISSHEICSKKMYWVQWYFSPIVRHTSVHILLALDAHYDMELEQLDVKIAFLHEDLEEDIYWQQPDGFVDSSKPNHVCKVDKFLYDLNSRLDSGIKDLIVLCFSRYSKVSKTSVFISKRCDEYVIYLLLYIDDMLITFQSGQNFKTESRARLGVWYERFMKDSANFGNGDIQR